MRRKAREASARLGTALGSAQKGGAVFLNQHESGSFPRFLDSWLAANGMPAHLSVDFEADAAAL